MYSAILTQKNDNFVFFAYGGGALRWRTADGRTGADPMKKAPSLFDMEERANAMFDNGDPVTFEVRMDQPHILPKTLKTEKVDAGCVRYYQKDCHV